MPASHAYRARGRQQRSDRTRERITAAVRELLAEGTFHESTVEQVAERAGIARATLYQHFRSRLDLVDAICDTFDRNPALGAVRTSVLLPDRREALRATIANTVRFWASEDAVLQQLYGVVAIDAAARDLVARQRADRHGEMERLARHLTDDAGARRRALALLMTLTSYESYRELRAVGLGEARIVATLQDAAGVLLLA